MPDFDFFVNYIPTIQLSNEKKTDCLGYIGDSTTQLCADYNEP